MWGTVSFPLFTAIKEIPLKTVISRFTEARASCWSSHSSYTVLWRVGFDRSLSFRTVGQRSANGYQGTWHRTVPLAITMAHKGFEERCCKLKEQKNNWSRVEENGGGRAGKDQILEHLGIWAYCKTWEDPKGQQSLKLWKQMSALTAELCGKPRFGSEVEGG